MSKFRYMLSSWRGALLIAVLVNFVVWFDLPWEGPLGDAVQDAGHVLIFGTIALLSLFILETSGWLGNEPWVRGIAAFCVAMILGVFVEIIQSTTTRQAELQDVLRNGAGAIVFLSIYLTRGDRFRSKQFASVLPVRKTILVGTMLVLLLAWTDLFSTVFTYVRRNSEFPVVARPCSGWGEIFIQKYNVDFDCVAPPEEWSLAPNNRVGEVSFPKMGYPSLSIVDLYSNWSGHNTLVLNLFSDEDAPFKLNVAVYDQAHSKQSDNFLKELVIVPGPNKITIPLSVVESAQGARPLDVQHINALELFVYKPSHLLVLYLDFIKLE